MRRVAIILVVSAVMAGGGWWLLSMNSGSREPRASEAPAESSPVAAAPSPTAAPASKPRATAAPKPEPTPSATPEPTIATLTFESDVADTSVFVNRRYLGKTPLTTTEVAPGEYQLNLSPAGFDPHVETITVVPGARTISVSFREIKLDASVAVGHKHTFGSCEGTLRATPAGLRYDTTHKDDAFSASLTNLEAFDIDYLAKHLRVKIRGGKTYTFADSDGNIDRLTIFHQEVDKVRKRLLAGK